MSEIRVYQTGGRWAQRGCRCGYGGAPATFAAADVAMRHVCSPTAAAEPKKGRIVHTRTPDPDGGPPLDSKWEARVLGDLRLEAAAAAKQGRCLIIARQAEVVIEGGRHRVDFALIDFEPIVDNGERLQAPEYFTADVHLVEAKGVDHPDGRRRRKQVLERWGLPIEVRKRPARKPRKGGR